MCILGVVLDVFMDHAQVDTALTTAHSILFPKGLENVVAASRARHDATVEAAHEARVAYLKKV